MFITPIITKEVTQKYPNFKAFSICVEASKIQHTNFIEQYMKEACELVLANSPSYRDEHLAQWAEAFVNFGAKPKKHPPSADALIKRVLKDGYLPDINPIVNIYNAISIKYAIPVGGENLEAYTSTPTLKISDGTEPFESFKNGELVVEHPEVGEVIWLDDTGVTCRRWNWRQGIRTRLNEDAKQMWFILESLPAMPLVELEKAGNELVEMLSKAMPEAKFETQVITAS